MSAQIQQIIRRIASSTYLTDKMNEMKRDERLCATKILSRKNQKSQATHFGVCVSNADIGSSQCDYNVAMCNGIRFNRKSTQCICFVYYGAGRNVRCVYGSNEIS